MTKTYLIQRSLGLLTPYLELVPAAERQHCMAHFGRVSGEFAAGVLSAEKFRSEMRRSQSKLRDLARRTRATSLPGVPGARDVASVADHKRNHRPTAFCFVCHSM